MLGFSSFALGAAAWTWLALDHGVASSSSVSPWAIGYSALGILLNTFAALAYTNILFSGGIARWASSAVASIATLTVFSDESPFGPLDAAPAIVMLVLFALQAASVLLTQRFVRRAPEPRG